MKNKASLFVFSRLSETTRKKMFDGIQHESPNYIPLIVEPHLDNLTETQVMKKPLYKFLVEPNKDLAYVAQLIKKKINSTEGIFLLIDGTFSVVLTTPMSTVYEQYKDEDGFLYITYSNEMIWG
jgi:hypothetical protein